MFTIDYFLWLSLEFLVLCNGNCLFPVIVLKKSEPVIWTIGLNPKDVSWLSFELEEGDRWWLRVILHLHLMLDRHQAVRLYSQCGVSVFCKDLAGFHLWKWNSSLSEAMGHVFLPMRSEIEGLQLHKMRFNCLSQE